MTTQLKQVIVPTQDPWVRTAGSHVFAPLEYAQLELRPKDRRSQREKKKIDTLIRVGFKRILGIPQTTSTERLLELGLHNTVDELIEAHFAAQVARLSSTKAGLKILDEAGIAAPRVEISDGVQLTRDEQEDIQVDPIPRNIHPVHHAGRREARARAILRSLGSDAKAAIFVDAAEYSTRRAFGVSVVDGKGQLVARASVCTDHVTVAEEIAIARIAALSEEANKYAAKPATDGWVHFCGSLRGTLGTSRTWAILRAMLEPEKSKSATSRTLQRIVHDYPGTDAELIQALKERKE
ncbi:hypothetical protein HPB50_021745 [Hyalomma asiaticum]|uniref:Uncharacterized protein n=1 Tax=Hyalomma asiaticum TaxID=266040 RepID=A0ACB7T0N5_HYAAI|nr:hypothetical protein HPB50_021745 [Hyalomma asiaticum]